MSEMYEAAIAVYLTRGGEVFIAPQYIVDWDATHHEGGSVPDFVAMDCGSREIVIVEVTAGAGVSALAGKINQRQQRWYRPVIRKLQRLRMFSDDWGIRTLVFVRETNISELRRRLTTPADDVTLLALESCMHGWDYHHDRVNSALSGSGSGLALSTYVAGDRSLNFAQSDV